MAFTAAMFHDIGQLVLDVCIPEQFASVLKEQKKSVLSLVSIEQARLGFDHAMIGAEMARHWNFPAEIEQTIQYWAMPERVPFSAVSGLVFMAVLLEGGLRGEDLISRLPESLCKNLGVTWSRIEAGLPNAGELDAGADLLLS